MSVITSTSPRRVVTATVVGVVTIAVATLLPALALYNASQDERQK